MIKGKTKIELRDVHTGEIEVIEEENMVTNALQYIFNPLGYIKAGATMYGSTFVNYCTKSLARRLAPGTVFSTFFSKK